MKRERKKPEETFIARTRQEFENEKITLGKQAYELGRIRGRKETIDKACEWIDNTLPNIEYITNASALRQTKRQYIDTFRNAVSNSPEFGGIKTCSSDKNLQGFDADYLQSKIDLHTKYMREHGITSEQQLATLDEMRVQEKYIPSADYLNAANKAFQKACGWLAAYPWYQGVYEEFVKELEENL